jgi:hypothetical protein
MRKEDLPASKFTEPSPGIRLRIATRGRSPEILLKTEYLRRCSRNIPEIFQKCFRDVPKVDVG